MSGVQARIKITKTQQKLLAQKLLSRRAINKNGCWIVLRVNGKRFANTTSPRVSMGGRSYSPGQASYLAFVNPKLEVDSSICHKCDNPRCINPEHIWCGNDSENAIDAFKKGRRKNPLIGHGPRPRHIEIALGRRRIMIRYHGDRWKDGYKKHYGKLPSYLKRFEE